MSVLLGYIIESDTKGVLMHLPHEDPKGEGKPRWAWSKPRSEAKLFANLPGARAAAASLNMAHILRIRERRDWTTLAPGEENYKEA